MTVRSVEKIGGTSMTRFPELLDSLFLHGGEPQYGRVFVVSAYGGITDLLLEHKHSGDPGVYALFSAGDDPDEWQDRLTDVGRRMRAINAELFDTDTGRARADRFVDGRIDDARRCLEDVQRVCRHAHFDVATWLHRVRELLSSMGEAHSARNTAALLREQGVNARFVDLTGWQDERSLTLDERIRDGLGQFDAATELAILPGYTHCRDGLVSRFGRGYTEVTLSRTAVIAGAEEAVIHKEYHLSSADPKLVGADNSRPIGRTNYDVADQLANLGMEAIHPQAAAPLRRAGIPLRVRNCFDPGHTGTLIDSGYRSDEPKVEIVAGRRGVTALEVFDQDMIGARQLAVETTIIEALQRRKVACVGKDINANTITHYLDAPLRTVRQLAALLQEEYPDATVTSRRVAFVCAIGTDLDLPGILAQCTRALGEAGVGILSAQQPLRGVDARFVVDDDDYARAVRALHEAVIDPERAVASAA